MTRLLHCQLAAALFAGFLCCSAIAQDAPRYAVTFDAQTRQAEVQLCLAQSHAIVKLAADSGWAMRFVSDFKRQGNAVLGTDADGWHAANWQAGECLGYRADLGAIAEANHGDVGWHAGEDLAVAPQLWLLRPDVQGNADAEVKITLPPGWSISAPWRETARDGNNIRFHIPNTPPDWSAAVAIGRFEEQRIALPGGTLRLTILHGADAPQTIKLRAWFDHVAHAVLNAYGRLPLPDVQVLMIPMGSHGQAVLFGQSVRGQGNALQLLIDPSQPAQEFADDWMAVHELSHLMHPYLGDRGAWLAEGLATYYQNVLRARGGMLTPLQAWDRLAQGFQRGAKMQGEDSLEQAATQMHRNHAYQRVYWAGAAFWLSVDRDLRRVSNGQRGLDSVLGQFRDCCLPAYREWAPEDFIARLDTLAATQIISSRYREFAAQREFPQWRSIYADLGIRDEGAHLRLEAAARDAAVRDAIMAPWSGNDEKVKENSARRNSQLPPRRP